MPFQPAIDEPSNAWPEVNLSSSKCRDGHGDVLLLAAGVGEAEVDELDFVFLHHASSRRRRSCAIKNLLAER